MMLVALSFKLQESYTAPRSTSRRGEQGLGPIGTLVVRDAALTTARGPPTAAELGAWQDLLECSAHRLRSSASSLLRKGDLPIVIMAGSRSNYLLQQLQNLDDLGRAQLVMVSFNRPMLTQTHPTELTKSFKIACTVKNLIIWPIWIRSDSTVAEESMNRHMKVVWMHTMSKVWQALDGYEGDVVFLEDDLLVSPDFFAAAGAASEIKQTSGMAIFALGGWAGQNTGSPAGRRPEQFVRKTWSAFPTMGYGFNRSLWDRVSAASDEITNSSGMDCLPQQKHCMHNLDDWSFAVSRNLRLRYNRTLDPYLRNFQVFKEVQLVQPLVSRVWHIGARSSIREDVSQKAGWEISAQPPWSGHVNHSNIRLHYTLLGGKFDFDGRKCPPASESSFTPAPSPCNLQHAVLHCQARGPDLRNAYARKVCQDPCIEKILECSSDPAVGAVVKLVGLEMNTVHDLASACFGLAKRSFVRPGCKSWTIQALGLR